MRFSPALFLLLLLSGHALAQEERIPAIRDLELDGELSEEGWKGVPVLVLDGEHLIESLSDDWVDEDDLSGRFQVSYTASELVIAGLVRDDREQWNPLVWHSGDDIEVFLDLGGEGGDAYDGNDYQLLLFPLAEWRTWGLTAWAGERGQSDGGLDGVRLLTKRLTDEQGRYRGYTFEAAIPLVNFPGFRIRPNTRIGFDIALSDGDEAPVQKTYMTWSGRSRLSMQPGRFGSLVFLEEPPAADSALAAPVAWAEPGLIVLAALVILFLLWSLRRRLSPLTEIPVRRKLVVIAVLLLLATLARLLPDGLARLGRNQRGRELEQKVGLLKEVLAEAEREWLLGTPETGAEPGRVLDLLTRGEVRPPERFEYRPVFIRPPAQRRTESETPVIDYARTVESGGVVSFEAPEPRPAEQVSVVLHLEPDPTGRLPLDDGRAVGRVRVVHETGDTKELELRYGRELDDHATAAPAPLPTRESSVAWRDSARGTHANEVRILLTSDAPVSRVQVEAFVQEAALVVHGATLIAPDGADPLPLVSLTRMGVPTNVWADRPPGSSLTLSPGDDPLVVPLSPRADRVWVFLAKQSMARDRSGREVLALTARAENGEQAEPLLLENDVHLASEVMYAEEHPPGFLARVAWRWIPLGGAPRHRDAVWLDGPPGGASVLEVRHIGEAETVIIAGVTGGRRIPHVAGPDLERLSYREPDGSYDLLPGTRAELADLTLTWYADGRAVETGVREGQVRESILGSSLPAAALSGPAAADPAPRLRTLGEESHLSLFLDVSGNGLEVLEASVPLPGPTGIARWSSTAFYVLLAILLLAVLLVLADLLSRLARLRTKLILGFALAALVPLLLLFFGLTGILEREEGRSERNTLLEQVSLAKAKIDEVRIQVRNHARNLQDDGGLLAALAREPAEYREATEAALREAVEQNLDLPGHPRAFVEDRFEDGGDAGPRVFPRGDEDHPFRSIRWPRNDFVYRWSELAFQGVSSRPVRDGRRTIAVELLADRDLLGDLKTRFGRRFELLLFTLRGYPYAGTIDFAEPDYSRASTRSRRAIRSEIDLNRAPVVRQEILAGAPFSVAYEVVRAEGGNPLALLAVAHPRREFVAARAQVQNLFVLLGALILILEVVVGAILTRRITNPLTLLSRGARAVAKGRLGTRVGVEVSDEIGTLAVSFNRMTAELERRMAELSKLNSAVRGLSGSLERDLVLEQAVAVFSEAVPGASGVVVAIVGEDQVELAAGSRLDGAFEPVRLPLVPGPLARAVQAAAPLVIDSVPEALAGAPELRAEREVLDGVASLAAVPFSAGREVAGAILILYEVPDPDLSRGVLEFLSTMAQQVAIALENARLYQLAIEDAATGLYTHSYFLTRLREETDRAVSGGRPLSVLLLSLEEVDHVYEARGPADGDHLMVEAARRLRAAARGMHIIARADRTTVEVLLPETGKEQAVEAARRLRESLTASPLTLPGDEARPVRCRPAMGLASCPDDAKSADFLLSEGRRALYQAVVDRAGEATDPAIEREEARLRAAGTGRFIFRSAKILELVETVDRIASSDVPILVQGETGVGKEVLAELVHEKSRRVSKPLVKVNCAALPETLLESELFGYERGAFTGADRKKPGRFEMADGGTLFLDEVGEMPPQTQVKLLRVLQDHVVERLGSTTGTSVDVRVIAATNRDLAAAIREGSFREDLYFRMNVVSLVIPPLRARREDIPVLVDHFVTSYLADHRPCGRRLSPGAMDRLFAHDWPGNVRELRNTIERALVIARGEEVGADEIVFPEATRESPVEAAPPPLRAEVAAELNLRQQQILEILARRDSITNREYVDLVGTSLRTGNRDLNDLIRRGLLVQVGRRRSAVYRLADRPGENP